MNDFTPIEIFYLVCAVIGGILFLIRVILFFTGSSSRRDLDMDADGDLDSDPGHADVGIKLVSPQGITAFFMMFGLVGLTLSKSGVNAIWTVFGGLSTGFFTMLLIAKIFAEMKNLQSEGK
jgi:hypothetical protein